MGRFFNNQATREVHGQYKGQEFVLCWVALSLCVSALTGTCKKNLVVLFESQSPGGVQELSLGFLFLLLEVDSWTESK